MKEHHLTTVGRVLCVLALSGVFDIALGHAGIEDAVPITTDGTPVVFHTSGKRRDQIWLSFSATDGESYLLQTTRLGTNAGNMLLLLYAPDGNTPLASGVHPDVGYYTGLPSSVSFRARETAIHYVLLDSLVNDELQLETGQKRDFNVLVRKFTPNVYFLDGANGDDNEGDGSAAYPWATITNALSHAVGTLSAPAEIDVAAGTYNELITLRENVTLLGGFRPNTWNWNPEAYPTVIDGQSGPVVTGADNAQMIGFVLQNSGTPWEGDVAASFIGNSPMLAHCVIRNSAEVNIYGMTSPGVWAPSGPRIVDCVITNSGPHSIAYQASFPVLFGNRFVASRGGAVWSATELKPVGGYLARNLFLLCPGNLSATAPYPADDGGAIHVVFSQDLIEANTFVRCAGSRGGAIYLDLARNTTAYLYSNVFADCLAGGGGGAICSLESRPDLRNNIFIGNSATNWGYNCQGGAICIKPYNFRSHCEGNVFVGNHSAGDGGGVYQEGTYSDFRNNTVYSNQADGSGAGIYCVTAS